MNNYRCYIHLANRIVNGERNDTAGIVKIGFDWGRPGKMARYRSLSTDPIISVRMEPFLLYIRGEISNTKHSVRFA